MKNRDLEIEIAQGAGKAKRCSGKAVHGLTFKEVLSDFHRLQSPGARAAFARTWLSKACDALCETWEVLYELLDLVKEQELYRSPSSLQEGKSEIYVTFPDFVAGVLGPTVKAWAAEEERFHLCHFFPELLAVFKSASEFQLSCKKAERAAPKNAWEVWSRAGLGVPLWGDLPCEVKAYWNRHFRKKDLSRHRLIKYLVRKQLLAPELAQKLLLSTDACAFEHLPVFTPAQEGGSINMIHDVDNMDEISMNIISDNCSSDSNADSMNAVSGNLPPDSSDRDSLAAENMPILLPFSPLSGTEKQVKWASEIRERVISSVGELSSINPSLQAHAVAARNYLAASVLPAKFWIEGRDNPAIAWLAYGAAIAGGVRHVDCHTHQSSSQGTSERKIQTIPTKLFVLRDSTGRGRPFGESTVRAMRVMVEFCDGSSDIQVQILRVTPEENVHNVHKVTEGAEGRYVELSPLRSFLPAGWAAQKIDAIVVRAYKTSDRIGGSDITAWVFPAA